MPQAGGGLFKESMLDKSIASGKEHRKPYRGAKQIDTSCRNHGGKTKSREHRECPWCAGNRQANNRRQLERANELIKED